MRNIALILILSILACTVQAQKKRELNIPVEMTYCLPKVVYRLDVTMNCVRHLPGPLAAYASEKLQIEPRTRQVWEEWSVADVRIVPESVPDKDAVYKISACGDYTPVTLSLTPQGFIAGVSAVAGARGAACREAGMHYKADPECMKELDILKARSMNHLKEVLDSNFTFQEVDGEMKKIWDPIIHYASKTPADYAKEAVSEIFRIRSERSRLLASENSLPDGRSLETVLREFDRAEAELLELFLGKDIRLTVKRTVRCEPEKTNTPQVAFRFSPAKGLVDRKDVTAEAYMLNITDVIVKAGAQPAGQVQGGPSVQYRIPAVGVLQLLKDKKVLMAGHAVVPQLGETASFPLEVVSNDRLSLEYYPQLGSIRNISRHQ